MIPPISVRSIVRQMVQDFEIFDEISDLKGNMLEITKRYLNGRKNLPLEDVNVGFISGNDQSFFTTSQNVHDAYNSRFLLRFNELVLFIEQKKEKAPGL